VVPPNPVVWQKTLYRGTAAYVAPRAPITVAAAYHARRAFRSSVVDDDDDEEPPLPPEEEGSMPSLRR
jgi:hypothetical protein